MEKALEKMARQLMAYDEASLAALWEKYAARVQHFEPTKKWEESALVFGLIQAMRWKNQLFNFHWKESSNGPGLPPHGPELLSRSPYPRKVEEEHKGGKLLQFKGLVDKDEE